MSKNTIQKQEESWVNDFRKLMMVENIGNSEFMRSNNFSVAVGFILSLLAQREEEVKRECEAEQITLVKRIDEIKMNAERKAFDDGKEDTKRELRKKIKKIEENICYHFHDEPCDCINISVKEYHKKILSLLAGKEES